MQIYSARAEWYPLIDPREDHADEAGVYADAIRAAAGPGARTLLELGAGAEVVQLRGGSHHSFLVEQQNGIVLVDAPFYEDRGEALSEYVAQTYPGKPITHVVASHFHEDHVAGIREVLGSNPSAQLVVHESVRDTWRTLIRTAPQWQVPSTSLPRSVRLAVLARGKTDLVMKRLAHVAARRAGHERTRPLPAGSCVVR